MIKAPEILIGEFETELERILNYWITNAIDIENGGFCGEINSEGIVNGTASKGAVLNFRILWTFSAAYNYNRNPKYLEVANIAYNYVIDHFVDKQFGGVYWEVDCKGNVINTRKQTYAQGFAIYAFSEYFKASCNPESLNFAINLFELIEKNCLDYKFGGYLEALSRDWKPVEDMRLSPKDANLPKSMNTHLHILEPYTNLYRVWPDSYLSKSIFGLIQVFIKRIINPETTHLNLFFDKDWNSQSSIVSYGHDIEAAWLLHEAAEVLNNAYLLHQVEDLALKMADTTIDNGSDSDGSVFYEKENGHLDTDKHWWPQAEAIVGYLNAYQISHETKYLNQALQVWDFVQKHMLDTEKGEWHWRVNKDGRPYANDIKTGFWKCPYHNSRTMIEAAQRIKKITIS